MVDSTVIYLELYLHRHVFKFFIPFYNNRYKEWSTFKKSPLKFFSVLDCLNVFVCVLKIGCVWTLQYELL